MEATDFAPYFERWTEEEMANCAICLCHMVDKGLCSYIAKRDREFVEQGGIRERMTAARLGYRTNQKDEIARLQAENTRLQSDLQTAQAQLRATQAEVARLQAILSSRS